MREHAETGDVDISQMMRAVNQVETLLNLSAQAKFGSTSPRRLPVIDFNSESFAFVNLRLVQRSFDTAMMKAVGAAIFPGRRLGRLSCSLYCLP